MWCLGHGDIQKLAYRLPCFTSGSVRCLSYLANRIFLVSRPFCVSASSEVRCARFHVGPSGVGRPGVNVWPSSDVSHLFFAPRPSSEVSRVRFYVGPSGVSRRSLNFRPSSEASRLFFALRPSSEVSRVRFYVGPFGASRRDELNIWNITKNYTLVPY